MPPDVGGYGNQRCLIGGFDEFPALPGAFPLSRLIGLSVDLPTEPASASQRGARKY